MRKTQVACRPARGSMWKGTFCGGETSPCEDENFQRLLAVGPNSGSARSSGHFCAHGISLLFFRAFRYTAREEREVSTYFSYGNSPLRMSSNRDQKTEP